MKKIAKRPFAGKLPLCRVLSSCGKMALGYAEPKGKNAMTLALYDTIFGKKMCRFPEPAEYGHPMAFSPHGRTVLMWERRPDGKLADGGDQVRLRLLAYSTATAELLWQYVLESTYTEKTLSFLFYYPFVRFTPDTLQVALFGGDMKLRLLDAKAGRLVQSSSVSDDVPVADAALAPGARSIALLLADGSVGLWDVESAKRIRQYRKARENVMVNKRKKSGFGGGKAGSGGLGVKSHPESVGKTYGARWISISPDGKLLAVAPRTTDAFVYNVATGKELARFQGHEQIIESLAFAPDGKTLVTVRADSTGLVWDLGPVRSEAGDCK